MATAAEALDRFAEATGINLWVLDRLARTLRAAPGDLWPLSRKGGGKHTRHVEPRHLVNLILALSAEPSEAVEAIHRLRDLRCEHRTRNLGLLSLPHIGKAPPLISDLALGQLLELLIIAAAQSIIGNPGGSATNHLDIFTIYLAPSTCYACIQSFDERKAPVIDTYRSAQENLLSASRPRAYINKSIGFGFEIIAVAGEILANDSRTQQGNLGIPAPGGTDTPEKETPTLSQGPALQTDQPPHTEQPGTHTREASGERESAQPLSADHSSMTAGRPRSSSERATTSDDDPSPAVLCAA